MEQQPIPETKKYGAHLPALAIATILLLVATLGIPGYIAGFCFRFTGDTDTMVTLADHGELLGRSNICMCIFLTPAHFAVQIAPPLLDIYCNQFLAAIGHDNAVRYFGEVD